MPPNRLLADNRFARLFKYESSKPSKPGLEPGGYGR